jgi:hypothetical protein
MAKYKLLKHGGVKDTETGAFIPEDTGNRHWIEYQEWLSIEGNVADEAQTLEEVKAEKILEIKTIAGATIIGSFPDHKQRNLLARTNELLLKKINETITQEEEAELSSNEAIWTWVKGVRASSNGTEVLVNACTTKEEVAAIIFAPLAYS